MKILLTGGGGREHALAWKIAQSSDIEKLYIAPGNAGTALVGENVDIAVDDFPHLIQFAKNEKIDLTVIGPEDPLAAGIVDAFGEHGLKVFGPSKKAAVIESSKIFAKELMRKHNIPTADFRTYQSIDDAKNYLRVTTYPKVIKADGLAAGKGVAVCQNEQEALAAVDTMLVEKKFGAAGNKILIEDFMKGEEASLLALTDGKSVIPLVAAQDHKAAFDHDRGPNTGGMGAYSPAPLVTADVYRRVETRILVPVIHALNHSERTFRGLLYVGLMIAHGEPKVVEFNCRFGDPETQVVLPKLKSDLVPLLRACAEDTLEDQMDSVEWDARHVLSVALCSGGYPGSYKKGYEIFGLKEAEAMKDVLVFHAGTQLRDGKVWTNGGRVLNVTGMGNTLAEAKQRAYAAVAKIKFHDMHFRTDIGYKAL